MGKQAGYGSPIIITLPTRDVLVIFSEYSLLGFDANNGELLWTHNLDDLGELPCNPPLFDKGYIYYVAGPRNGAVKLELSKDGSSIKEIWRNKEFDTFYGGFVKVENYLYGSVEKERIMQSLDIHSGQITGFLNSNKGTLYYSIFPIQIFKNK